MAVDGVAPRAKMNQQRARRFVGGLEKETSMQGFEDAKKEVEDNLNINLDYEPNVSWDSNVITPGTQFMKKVADALLSYSIKRCQESELWKNLKVIVSDASVPGEGEHKIYEFIRQQKKSPNYNPNLRHIIHGLDADLIMLSLLTHEKNFFVLREDNSFKSPSFKSSVSNMYFKGLMRISMTELRQFLEGFFEDMKGYLGSNYDLFRVIDDFVFLCFFVGNDFLPNFPALDIEEGAIDMLIDLYKIAVSAKKSYITDGDQINLERLFDLLELINNVEEMIFFSRYMVTRHRDVTTRYNVAKKQFKKEMIFNQKLGNLNSFVSKMAEDKAYLKKIKQEGIPSHIKKEDSNWRDLVYQWKFEIPKEKLKETKKNLSMSYIQGLIFVWKYYTTGIPSWSYYFPYHYAPFSQEILSFKDEILSEFKDYEFEKGKPFKPFDQLMSVLPKFSSHCLPESYRELMLDPNSNISYFYPDKFDRDMNGKSKDWKAVVLLPFINQQELLEITKKLENTLTDEEKERNSLGDSFIVLHKHNPDYSKGFNKLDNNDHSILLSKKIYLELSKPKKLPIDTKLNDVVVASIHYPKQDETIKKSIKVEHEKLEPKIKNGKKVKNEKVEEIKDEKDLETKKKEVVEQIYLSSQNRTEKKERKKKEREEFRNEKRKREIEEFNSKKVKHE